MSDITYNVGVLLGRSPLSSSDQELAELLAGWAGGHIDAVAAARSVTVDPAARDRVITKAVANYMGSSREGITQQSVTVDDATITRTYAKDGDGGDVGDVEILTEWWAELGIRMGGEAFTITPYFPPRTTDTYYPRGYDCAWY